ncbi:PD-(D/E)XK nuclease family protein [Flavobacteriaceae bacterium Ap0902]|nr:PD-(D/E)XK nuclease family protein [Flavobacteriaceae bacterium Ap0902]
MMRTFLQEVVTDLMQEHTDFSKTVLVVPGMRPKAFIKKTFIEEGFQGILPEILTIEELLEKLTTLKMVSGIPLWFSTFQSYKTVTDNEKSFEDFLKFAPTLLKDFDDIDASLTNHQGLLNMMISEERIKNWGKDMDIGLSHIMSNHIGFWTDARATFYELRKTLLNEGKAYRGLLARRAKELTSNYLANHREEFIFIGFNALTQAEKEILIQMMDADRATAYWDADTYYLENKNQEAGDFLRQYRKIFGDKFKFIASNFEQTKDLTIINVPKQETQSKLVGNLLDKLNEEQKNKTAIVLGDEQLLPSVLNSLPDSVEKINITMGLPLSSIPMAFFFKEIIKLHANKEKFDVNKKYYYQNIIHILTDNNFAHLFNPESSEILNAIRTQNIIFYEEDKLTALGKVFHLFKSPKHIHDFPAMIVDWINYVQKETNTSDFQSEYLFRFRSIFIQLDNFLKLFPYIENYKSLNQLFNQLLQSESVSFVGEPLVGLQLLGMLETRLLDFEHIIITSVNEGTLPLGRQENSLIPFDFKKNYGLNTFLENDAVYAYHFYRLIQRCTSATFIYNSDSEGLGSGEPSRFLLQLLLESPHQIKQITASPVFNKDKKIALEVEKTDFVQNKLEEWKNYISPSALGGYLWDPITFYKRYILGLREEDEVEEFAGDATLGSVIHETLDLLYRPYIDTILTPDIYKKIRQDKESVFNNIVQEMLLKGNEKRGKNIVILQVAREMIDNVLRKDLKLCQEKELIIREIEPSFHATYQTPQGHKVTFKGKIDRVDEVDNVIRVLDYKTGSVNPNDLKFTEKNIEKISTEKQSAKAIQLAIYTYMYFSAKPEMRELTAGIYPLRYFSKDIQPLQWNKNGLIITESLDHFMEPIGMLIDEILNPTIPFMAAED